MFAIWDVNVLSHLNTFQQIFTYLKSTKETLEESVKYV